MSEIDVIAPNLKRRLSGVTATIARLVPVQARMIGIVATGPGLPPETPHVALWRLPFLKRRLRVWHARRNTEMLLGLILRGLGLSRLKLMFTSASQRKHSGYTKWLISKMDAVVATSARTASYLERPATVILHGIDTATFTPPEDRAALRARLGLPDGLLIGCYGRIRAQKGTDAFVDAMIAALPAHPEATALVMGRATEGHGEFLSGLKAKVAEAGLSERLLFLPEVTVDRMADWYGALDLYIAPQRWEGFGLTPLEAMACGVPVVATTVGAFPEILTPETGALVEPGDPQALAEAAGRYLSDPEALRAAGQAARVHVEAGFRIEDEAAALVAIYRDLLA
ncbi:glycosyltransferase family 4 protein [Pararhodobacter sp. CCB-MM2]|uniref:glycosyltransferase family 4 protein n=1 Tax=Pararhodobacter sp. CCB-MM2 TaxID=1786003 RepID=UPI0008375FAC|nr:glycosyltransferase family 4 protein [Pararhodobacter sp. CCB-MM2]